MRLSDFDYKLPPELIAIEPAEKRDQSRLLVLDKKTGQMQHRHFFDLPEFLNKGDVLVLNNSRVIPARLIGHKETGGEVEVFLSKHTPPFARLASTRGEAGATLHLRQDYGGHVSRGITHPALRAPLSRGESLPTGVSRRIHSPLERGGSSTLETGCVNVWECLVKGRVKVGTKIIFSKKLVGVIHESPADDPMVKIVSFNLYGAAFMKEVEKIGQIPLPPYIEKRRREFPSPLRRGRTGGGYDRLDYQTVYAGLNKKGSVAAPTAGLHFTPALLKKIKAKGVKVEYVTLHVGLGTFLPVKTENIKEHKLHSEWAEIPARTLRAIAKAKASGHRVVAVGTTTTRTLEFFADKISNFQFPISNQIINSNVKNKSTKSLSKFDIGNLDFDIPKLSAWVDIFIYPPYKFQVVDALVTNFHLPHSSLLMLVSALATKKNIDKAYQEAIKQKYRFYSYGDAMLIT